MGAVHVLGLRWWNGRALRTRVSGGSCVGVVNIEAMDVADAWARCTFLVHGEFAELPVWARCTFKAWRTLPLGRGAHL